MLDLLRNYCVAWEAPCTRGHNIRKKSPTAITGDQKRTRHTQGLQVSANDEHYMARINCDSIRVWESNEKKREVWASILILMWPVLSRKSRKLNCKPRRKTIVSMTLGSKGAAQTECPRKRSKLYEFIVPLLGSSHCSPKAFSKSNTRELAGSITCKKETLSFTCKIV